MCGGQAAGALNALLSQTYKVILSILRTPSVYDLVEGFNARISSKEMNLVSPLDIAFILTSTHGFIQLSNGVWWNP